MQCETDKPLDAAIARGQQTSVTAFASAVNNQPELLDRKKPLAAK
uniref:Uncharacterized protein n=1 Tax=Anguilla anguilla TaxID=7936 RepID=A0A0E9R1M6_ANGAN